MTQAPVTLFLFPYAGGNGNIFRPWLSRLPAWIRPVPLSLPGRGSRFSEKPVATWPDAIADMQQQISGQISGRYAIFGHSLGAILGYEVAKSLMRVGRPSPMWFCASGCAAPACREWDDHWLSCPDEEFVERLRELSGTPPELLENIELLNLILPVLRADFHLSGTYEFAPEPRLRCPVHVLRGTGDDEVNEKEGSLDKWAEVTVSSDFSSTTIEGGHFFLQTSQDAVIHDVVTRLAMVREGRHEHV